MFYGGVIMMGRWPPLPKKHTAVMCVCVRVCVLRERKNRVESSAVTVFHHIFRLRGHLYDKLFPPSQHICPYLLGVIRL